MTDQEINEAVARGLGWFQHNKTKNWFHPTIKTHEFGDLKVPDYCHDIKAAWEVVEYCRRGNDHEGSFTLIHTPSCKWECTFSSNIGEELIQADTAPMSICLAFLKLEEK